MNDNERFFPLPEYLLPWFYENKRDLPWRKNKDAYAVWVSEIMLQQTRVEAAKAHYIRFMQTLPDVFSLAACDDEKLMKLWEGLGYYSRARNLKKCAVRVVEEYGGVFPSDKALLLKLPGIGEYTAGAVSSIAYDKKNPAVDGNVLRVCARVEGNFAPIDDTIGKKELYRRLESVYPEAAGDYTQSLMELGALVCLPENPRCEACPVRGNCIAERDGLQSVLPVIPQKAEKRHEKLSVFLILTPHGVAMKKRPEKGVLAGMYEFPNLPAESFGGDVREQIFSFGVKEGTIVEEKNHTHVFTHLVWEMTAYAVKTLSAPETFEYFTAERLSREISLASAFRWCAETVKKYE